MLMFSRFPLLVISFVGVSMKSCYSEARKSVIALRDHLVKVTSSCHSLYLAAVLALIQQPAEAAGDQRSVH